MKKDYAFKKYDLTLEWLCQTLLCIYDWFDAYICIYLIANRQVHLKNSQTYFKLVNTVSNASLRHCCVFLSFNLSSIAVREISPCSTQLDLAHARIQIFITSSNLTAQLIACLFIQCSFLEYIIHTLKFLRIKAFSWQVRNLYPFCVTRAVTWTL